MEATERIGRLIETLRRDGRVEVASAAIEFGAAEMTIRRDLDQLVERGVARRVRGGAVNLLMRGEELPFAMREIEAVEVKRRIGLSNGKLALLSAAARILSLFGASIGAAMPSMFFVLRKQVRT